MPFGESESEAAFAVLLASVGVPIGARPFGGVLKFVGVCCSGCVSVCTFVLLVKQVN